MEWIGIAYIKTKIMEKELTRTTSSQGANGVLNTFSPAYTTRGIEEDAYWFIKEFNDYSYHDQLAPDSKMYPEMWENSKAIALIAINKMLLIIDESILFKQSKRDYYKRLHQAIIDFKPNT